MSVFLALIAENAWTSRGERRLAREYLLELHGDLATDTVLHRVWLDISERQAAAASLLLSELEAERPSLTPGETAVALYSASKPLGLELGSPTYRDLVSSGNMRLMPDGVRRTLFRYEDYLTMTRAQLPLRANPFAGKGAVPGTVAEAIRRCHAACREPLFTATHSDLVMAADSALATAGEVQRRTMMAWRSIPNIRRLLDESLRQSLWFTERQRAIASRLLPALDAVDRIE